MSEVPSCSTSGTDPASPQFGPDCRGAGTWGGGEQEDAEAAQSLAEGGAAPGATE